MLEQRQEIELGKKFKEPRGTFEQILADMELKDKKQLRQEIMQHFKESGGFEVDIQGFGKVIIDDKRIDSSLKYIDNDAEKLAYMAIKPVLKRGIIITNREDHKDRGYGTVTFSAPVTINGIRGNMGVVVKQTGKNYYKVHRVLTPDGRALDLEDRQMQDLHLAKASQETAYQSLGEVAPPISPAPDSSEAVEEIKSQSEDDGKKYSIKAEDVFRRLKAQENSGGLELQTQSVSLTFIV